uniref:FYVE-type domain-containing protein n=1 Tax=Globisporangium ultimum (strain ATCC 200006 / CBS 805.95 / DAOM BR144) TaxID=431595 RepID=K3W6C1_GLOUD
MTFPTPAMAFPTLQVCPRDAKTLEVVAETQVQNLIEQHHAFVNEHKECADSKMWRRVRHRHGVRLFRERRRSAVKRERFEKSGSSIKTRKNNNRDVTPLLMLVGRIPGNLDDVMYGVMSPTTEAMKLQSSCVNDGLSDLAVLASIIMPSQSDPFRELSIKWAVKRHALNPLRRTRDLVYMESIGFTTTPSGERIGYQVKHSVDLPGAQPLNDLGIVRAHLSFCYVYRQRSENVVDVFMKGTISSLGDTFTNFACSSTAADIALAVVKTPYCSQMKKLAWVLKTGKQTTPAPSSHVLFPSKSCAVCAQNVPSVRSPREAYRNTCRICCERVCARCLVLKTMRCMTSLDDHRLVSTKMHFCTRCLRHANEENAQNVALHDILADEGCRTQERALDIIRKLRIDSISTCSLDEDFNFNSTSSLYYMQ